MQNPIPSNSRFSYTPLCTACEYYYLWSVTSAESRSHSHRTSNRHTAMAAPPDNVPSFIAAQLSHLLSHFRLTLKALSLSLSLFLLLFLFPFSLTFSFLFFSLSGWTNVVRRQIQLRPPRSLHPPHPLLPRLHQMYFFLQFPFHFSFNSELN